MTHDHDDPQLPPHGHAPDNGNRMACRRCNAPTLVSTLNHYGARCVGCYEQFLTEPQPKHDVGDKRLEPLGWARALQRREEGAERLTLSQREMWRSALGHREQAEWIDGAGFKGIEADKLPESMRPRSSHHSRAGARFAEVVS